MYSCFFVSGQKRKYHWTLGKIVKQIKPDINLRAYS